MFAFGNNKNYHNQLSYASFIEKTSKNKHSIHFAMAVLHLAGKREDRPVLMTQQILCLEIGKSLNCTKKLQLAN